MSTESNTRKNISANAIFPPPKFKRCCFTVFANVLLYHHRKGMSSATSPCRLRRLSMQNSDNRRYFI